MSTKHTTKNGWTITTDRGVHILEAGGATTIMDDLVWEDLKEYFQHERDHELGRWRDPYDPDKVVYKNTEDSIRVLDESMGEVDYWSRDEASLQTMESSDSLTARRYFEAHPKPDPKPWEDAQLGDVWALTFDGGDPVAAMVQNSNVFDTHLLFAWEDDGCYLDEETITSGRRIWPAEKGEDK